jgi:hypothetical protein
MTPLALLAQLSLAAISGHHDAAAISWRARAEGVPPLLAVAIAEVETGHNWRDSLVRGRLGEVGRFQIRPALWSSAFHGACRAVSTRAGNRHCAMHILRWCYERHGSWSAAIRCFNGGGAASARYLRRVQFALGRLSLACLAAPAACGAPHAVFLDDSMMAQLGRLADTATIEHGRCLIGKVEGDTAFIDLAVAPASELGTPIGVTFGPCSIATLALWHNHLPFEFSFTGEKVGPVPPAFACALSPQDRFSASRPEAPAYTLIHVTHAVYCMWVKVEDGKNLRLVRVRIQ